METKKTIPVRAKTIKLIENTGGKLHDIGFGNDFLDITLKVQTTKEKIEKLDLIKLKTFVYQKTLLRVKRQPKEWEKISANHISDKGLISRTYKEVLPLNNKKQITQFKNGQRTWIDISPVVYIHNGILFSHKKG